MVLFQVVMRSGWIFKTESIIMPAVLDSLGGAGWLRGCLPLLNRFGQSIPPLLAARRVKITPRKKWALAIASSAMSLAFLGLAAVWLLDSGAAVPASWLPIIFLAMYALFFTATGIMQLCFHTLQGKLIQPTHRGRLILVANLAGAAAAITLAAWLLPRWVSDEGAEFGWVFCFAGGCFAVAALAATLLREPADGFQQLPQPVRQLFVNAWNTLRDDPNFRRLAISGATFGCSLMLFPHYQALGFGQQQTTFRDLIAWVILQNAGTAMFSFVAGPLADWRGNRMVLQGLLFILCCVPVTAILVFESGYSAAYPIVFVLVGLTPVTFKVFNNYTLETAKAAEHPQYLSTLSLCVGTPVLLSPAVGGLVEVTGFYPVFLVITLILAVGWVLSLKLNEPRHQ